MSSKIPKVSVIVPVFNVEDYLEKCLNSIICQTLYEIEIICIDDCSVDNSLKILTDFSKNDKRIKVVEFKQKQNAAMARNVGLIIATGEYLGFVDSDDYIDHDFYEKLYKKAKDDDSEIVKAKRKEIPPLPSAGKLLDISIMNAFETITRLGGFIILFSVLSAALNQYLALGNATPCFLGIFEISTGLPAIAASSLSTEARYILSMGCTSLGGLCVMAQTNTVIRGSGLPLGPYVEGKLLNASLALIFSLLFLKCV